MSTHTPTWVDSHCHLDFADFQEEGVATIVERAQLNRVAHMLTISTHTQRITRYTEIADQFANIWTTIGVHPHQANEEIEKDITAEKLIALSASHAKIVGIGEAGLDYHYDYAPREQQHKVFQAHIDAAIETGLPLIIHAREADDDMIDILTRSGAKNGKLKAIMHCFSSTKKLADFALECGFYLSFSGIVTFPKATDLHDICKATPLDRILVETDAPYLAPVPYRGKRNEPAFVSHTGRFIATLHGIEEGKMADQTTKNFFRLFSKIKKHDSK